MDKRTFLPRPILTIFVSWDSVCPRELSLHYCSLIYQNNIKKLRLMNPMLERIEMGKLSAYIYVIGSELNGLIVWYH